MRRLIAFDCAGDILVATLDAAEGTTGLLIVSGGNEVRGGAHRAMATLAARLAADGIPVFRYDRRGVGDSEGENGGFETAAPDLRAALATFRREQPGLKRVIGFGNCDAASLLAIEGKAAGLDAVILANPWMLPPTDDLPPAAAIRAIYVEKLRQPHQWWRLLTGSVDLQRFVRGLAKLSRTGGQISPLATRVRDGLSEWADDARVVLAEGDNTARTYAATAHGIPVRTIVIPTASHSFARAADQIALETAIRDAI